MNAFRELLDGAIGPAPPSTIDIDRTIMRARRQGWIRPLTGAFVVAALATAAVTLVSAAHDRAAPPVAPVSPDLIMPPPFTPVPVYYFPEYVHGAQIIAEASGPLSQEAIELTFVPTALAEELAVFIRCDLGGTDVDLDLVARLGSGSVQVIGSCDEDGEVWKALPLQGWEAFVSVGDLRTITFWATGTNRRTPPDGTFGIAVGESVPFGDYPLPSAPPTLPAIDPELEVGFPPGVDAPEIEGRLRAASEDPTAPRSLTIEWPRYLQIVARAQTPGRLHIEINDTMVGKISVWDYQQRDTGPDQMAGLNWADTLEHVPEVGQRVTVTVTPEYLAGDWVVFFLS